MSDAASSPHPVRASGHLTDLVEGVGAILVIGFFCLILYSMIGLFVYPPLFIKADWSFFLAMFTGFFGIAVVAAGDRAGVLWAPRQGADRPAGIGSRLGPLCFAGLLAGLTIMHAWRALGDFRTNAKTIVGELPLGPIQIALAVLCAFAALIALAGLWRANGGPGAPAPKEPDLDI
jgi:TRAP-type C4-dicarboxylate transport system permease small subunit